MRTFFNFVRGNAQHEETTAVVINQATLRFITFTIPYLSTMVVFLNQYIRTTVKKET